MVLIQGTTPTIIINIKNDIDFSQIAGASLTISQRDKVRVHKDITDITVNPVERRIKVLLTQEDTLNLREGDATIQVRILMSDGTALASLEKEIGVVGTQGGEISSEEYTPEQWTIGPEPTIERIRLNLIPVGTMPICHASQFDKKRQIEIELYNGAQPYFLSDEVLELDIKKPDGNLVTMDVPYDVGSNSVIFETTEQACAVAGKCLCELRVTKGDTRLGSLNFYLVVEAAPDENGITSQSEIKNLNRQIDDYLDEVLPDAIAEDVPPIVEQVIGENYYDKTEVDTALATKADATATAEALNGKADVLAVNNALALKADKTEVNAIIGDLYSISDNLFDFDNVVSNKVPASIGSNYDDFTNLSGWKTSNYIPVEAGQKYALILNGNITQGAVFRVACYKNGKETYKSEAQESNPYTIPGGVDHIRFFSNTSNLFASITATSFKKYDASMDTTWQPYGKTENYLKSKSVVDYGVFVSGSNYYHFVNFGNKTLIRLFKREGSNNLFQFSALCEGGVYQNGIYISNTIATNGTDTVGPISIMRQGVDSGGNWSGGWHTKTINGVAYPTAEQNSLDIRVNGESIVGKNGMHYGKCVAIVKNSLYFPQTITGADLSQATKSIEETVEYILDDKMTARVSHKYVADTRVILYYGMQAVRVGFDSALLPNNENEIVFDSMVGDVVLDNPERLIAVKNSAWNYDLILKDFGLAELKHNPGTGTNKYGSLPQNTRKIYWVLIEGTYDYSFIPNGKILSWEGIYNIYPN